MYQEERWFRILKDRKRDTGKSQKQLALELGVNQSTLSQILNGTGNYGNGTASTAKIAERVIRIYDRVTCPHLSDIAHRPVSITLQECRSHAQRATPLPTPAGIQHWAECQNCPKRNFL